MGSAGSDINGDGYADLLTSAQSSSAYQSKIGSVFVFYGPFYGARCKDDADFSVYGAQRESYLGYSVATAGDVNADNMDDFTIASVGGPVSSGEANGTGWLVLGPVSGTARIGEAAAWQFDSTDPDGGARFTAGPIDADDDGIPDLLFGLPDADGGTGLAAVVPGASLF